jgi:hypothetical protein
VKEIKYTIKDPRAIEVGNGVVTLNAFGSFDFVFKTPENINLGKIVVDFEIEKAEKYEAESKKFTHNFIVQEVSFLNINY